MKKSLILVGLLSIGYAHAQYEEKVGINTETPTATLNVKSKTGTTSATKNFELENANGTKMVTVLDDGKVGIGTEAPQEKLSVFGGKISVTGDGTYTGYLEDVHLKFNRPSDAYVSNINPKGRLTFLTGGTTTNGDGIRMTINEVGNVGIGISETGSRLSIKGSSNYGVVRVYSNSPSDESTIGYTIDGTPSERTWITGVVPNIGKGFSILRGGAGKMYIAENGNITIGTFYKPDSNNYRLYVNADADPLKLEGLQETSDASAKNLVVVDGVVKIGSATASTGATQVGTGENSMPCNDANRGKMNFQRDITLSGGGTADAFAVCLKGSDGQHYWRYLYGSAGVSNLTGNFGENLQK